MSSCIDYRPPPPPPPPPPPKPEPRKVAPKVDVDDAGHAAANERVANAKPAHAVKADKASEVVQHAHREKFANEGTAKAREHTRVADHRIDDAAKAIDRAQSDDAKRAAAVKATRVVADELANKSPDEQRAILDRSAGALGKIASGLDTLDADDTTKAITNLTKAAESVGPQLATKITDPIARALPTELEGHGDNRGELMDGIESAMNAGKGGVFGVALAQSAQKVPELVDNGFAAEVTGKVRDTMQSARDEFADARETADVLDARLAVVVQDWQKSGALSDDAIQAGVEAYKKEHAEDYEAADAASKKLASLLPGAGLAATGPDLSGVVEQGAFAGGGRAGVYAAPDDEVGSELQEVARSALTQVPALAKSDDGAHMIANHVERNSAYLDEAKKLLGAADDPKTAKANLESFDNAILKSVAVGGPALVQMGERDRLEALTAGAARFVHDRKLGGALDQYAEDIKALPEGLEGVSLGQKLAGSAASIARASLGDIDQNTPEGARLETRFRAVGAAFGLGALAFNAATFDPKDAQSIVRTAGSATAAGVSVAELAGKNLGRLGLGVGVAFSAADVAINLAKGDVGAAAASSLPLAGAGIGFAVGGPLGAGVGLAVGGLVSTAISLFGGGDAPDEMQEKATDSFLQAALEKDGVANAETAAFRLRDVDEHDDEFEGVGSSIAKLAKAGGTTPRAILDELAAMPSNNVHAAVRTILEAKPDDGELSREQAASVLATIRQLSALGDQELPFD